VITTGLSIQNRRRQRRSLQINPRRDTISGVPGPPRPNSANGSSQDEYDESESESDRVLSSSNEDIHQAEDDDDDHTALGVGTTENNAVFTPQPNAFSHPPSSNTARSLDVPAPGSYFPMHPQSGSAPASTRLHPGRTIERPSYQGRPQTSHARPTMSTTRSSTHQADHDAALRASLTTLLSCAAAVRGSSKPNDLNPTTTTRPSRIVEPATLRLVPESHFLGDDEPPTQFQTQTLSHSPTSPRSIASKRKARSQSKERLAKKTRSGTPKSASAAATYPVDYATMSLSPTLMTWMISAGVVLVFSAISFSAGYAWGKEVGRFEAGEAGIVSGGCGREAVRGSGSGLRRLRWSASTNVRT
jgi:hypothetical protein